MILHSGTCEDCDYSWDDELHQYKVCPNCGLSNIVTWGRSVKTKGRVNLNAIKHHV